MVIRSDHGVRFRRQSQKMVLRRVWTRRWRSRNWLVAGLELVNLTAPAAWRFHGLGYTGYKGCVSLYVNPQKHGKDGDGFDWLTGYVIHLLLSLRPQDFIDIMFKRRASLICLEAGTLNVTIRDINRLHISLEFPSSLPYKRRPRHLQLPQPQRVKTRELPCPVLPQSQDKSPISSSVPQQCLEAHVQVR